MTNGYQGKNTWANSPVTWKSYPDSAEIIRQFALARDALVKGLPVYAVHMQTTGFKPENGDRIIQVAAVRILMENGHFVNGGEFSSWINPGRPIPDFVSRQSGLTDAFLSNYPEQNKVMVKFFSFVGPNPVIVTYHTGFCMDFLSAASVEAGIQFSPYALLDLCSMAMHIIRIEQYDRYTFKNMADILGIHFAEVRDALLDAKSYAQAFLLLASRFPTGTIPPRFMGWRILDDGQGKWEMQVGTDLGVASYDIFSQSWKELTPGFFSKADMAALEATVAAAFGETNIYAAANSAYRQIGAAA